MPAKARSFQRWDAFEGSSLSYQVFRKYMSELDGILAAQTVAGRYAYGQLKAGGANWEDSAKTHFDFHNVLFDFQNLKAWSASFELHNRWLTLNYVLTLSSNLETYMASVISVAIESDPGVLLGSSRAVDGAALMKLGTRQLDVAEQLEKCTRGDWNARISSYQKIFDYVPAEVSSKSASLEAIRDIRNKAGHAFGRDIKAARKHGSKVILPFPTLSRKRAVAYRDIIHGAAKAIDKHLLDRHIGDFEVVKFYHRLYPSLHKHVPPQQRAIYFKKEVGAFGSMPRPKEYCNALVRYYEGI